MRQQLGGEAVRLGAFRPAQRVANDRAVTVVQALPAVAAFVVLSDAVGEHDGVVARHVS